MEQGDSIIGISAVSANHITKRQRKEKEVQIDAELAAKVDA